MRRRMLLIGLDAADSRLIEGCLGSHGVEVSQIEDTRSLEASVAQKPPMAVIVDSSVIAGEDDPWHRWFGGIKTSSRPAPPVIPVLPSEDPATRSEIVRLAGRRGAPGWLERPLRAEMLERMLRSLDAKAAGESSFDFKAEISPRAFTLLGATAFVVFIATWCLLAYGGLVRPLFLPSPTDVVSDLAELFLKRDFLSDIGASVYRVLGGFGFAALLAIPLGIAMGSFRPVEAFLRPFCDFVRYMPAAAFIPLIILWLGIGHSQKVAVIFMGVFFYLLVMIAGVAEGVEKELLDTARTLGASRLQILAKVIVPACWPGILESLRTMIGAAWTYLIVAELVAAEVGIGYRILEAQRFLQTGRVIAGILVIGGIGVLTDLFFRWLIRVAAPWRDA